jgi:hypothetical protein
MDSDANCLRRVALAISSYRSDDSVLALLERTKQAAMGFGAVIVVDSQGSGELEQALSRMTWPCPVTYFSATTNLGSAGNLAERLQRAAQTKLDWVYAVNHDGDLQPSRVASLVEIGEREAGQGRPIGAVYPLRRLPKRGNSYDITGRFRVPLTAIRRSRRPGPGVLDVYWSSSNGALYALEPVRRGLLPWADLWMGYEDLGYGWLLHQHGYRQLLASDVMVEDGYEYQERRGVWMTQKPSWYAYYHARNFLLVAGRTRQPAYARAAIMARLLLELGVTTALRDHKRERLALTVRGMVDGLLGRAGKYKVP